MIGSRIVNRLIGMGYQVRVLSRQKGFSNPAVQLFSGNLSDNDVLRSFLSGSQYVFHCAAELSDEKLMWKVNVEGTKLLVDVASKEGVEYFCFLSSAGVVGLTDHQWVDESTPCNPQNAYEQSKWEAEKVVCQGLPGCNVVMLRPVDVFDEKALGTLKYFLGGGWKTWLKVFLQGRECTHLVHAEDIAAAATYFLSYSNNHPECFFVSCDDDPFNCFAGIQALINSENKYQTSGYPHLTWALPVVIPHVARLLLKKRKNRGDVRYSSKKLHSAGFEFPVGLRDGIRSVVQSCRRDA